MPASRATAQPAPGCVEESVARRTAYEHGRPEVRPPGGAEGPRPGQAARAMDGRAAGKRPGQAARARDGRAAVKLA